MPRSLRYKPPGRAARGGRKETFNAALEQSEQFMHTAAVAGVATRPVLLFYAVTQAGWVVSAVAVSRTNQEWRLSGGHGISARDLNRLSCPLASLELQDSGTRSFTAVAGSLQVASLPQRTPLGDLWCLVADAERFPLPHQGRGRMVTIEPRVLPPRTDHSSFDPARHGAPHTHVTDARCDDATGPSAPRVRP